MQGQKQGLSKFKNCSPQEEYPDKCKYCRMNCGGKCIYSHEQIPKDEELMLDKTSNSSRSNH